MDSVEIHQLLTDGLDDCEVQLEADGNKVSVLLVSPSFEGLSRVKRQQLVYALLNEKIASGEIHAVMMKTMTPAEQEAANG